MALEKGDDVIIKNHSAKLYGTVEEVRKGGKYVVKFWDPKWIPGTMEYKEEFLEVLGKRRFVCFHKWGLEKRFMFDIMKCEECGEEKDYNPMLGDEI